MRLPMMLAPKRSVVAHEQHRPFILFERAFECLDVLDVEMVRRLVEHQEVRARERDERERDPGPIVVAFFGNAIEGPFAEAEDRIGRIAHLLVEYFDGAR